MTDRNRNRWITRLSATALGSLLIGLPATGARAAEPTTAAEARQMAAQASDRAEQYRALGGTGYKAGLVQREEQAAARYNALADKLECPPGETAQSATAAPEGAPAAPNPLCMASKPVVQATCPGNTAGE